MFYVYSGAFDDFPAYRESIEQAGAVLASVSTIGGVLVLETDSLIDLSEYLPQDTPSGV